MFQIILSIFIAILSGPEPERPNILFIVSEDNGPELGCYGAPIKTPNLDALAARGVLFEKAFVPQAGCSQSRASFLTGLYPHQHGQIGLATWKYSLYEQDIPNVTKSLHKAGYTTGIIGKLHVNPEDAFVFDWQPEDVDLRGSNFKRKKLNKYISEAAAFMTQSHKPFYLQVNFPDAHEPFLPQVDGVPTHPLNWQNVEALPYMEINDSTLRQQTADYYNCLMRLDKYVGDLLDALEKTGKSKNTIVVYIGDHGADLLRGKRTCYEGGLRIPMIIADGRSNSFSKRDSNMVSTLDLYPTFLSLAGLEIPEYLPGISLEPSLNGEDGEVRKYLFAEYHTHSNHDPYPQRCVRNERYKLIHNLLPEVENPGFNYTLDHVVQYTENDIRKNADSTIWKAYINMKKPPEFELYDLENDPHEFNNLADAPNHLETLELMKSNLLEWQKQTNDPMIDQEIARKVFDAINTTGTREKERTMVPYFDWMYPEKMVWKRP